MKPGPAVSTAPAGRRGPAAWRLAEGAGLAWALGMALFTALYFALYLLGVGGTIALPAALAVTAVGILVGARLLRAEGATEATGAARGVAARVTATVTALGLGLAAAQVGLAAWLALRSPLNSFDAWSVWAFKARMFALGGPRPGYFHDPLTLHTHPDYPLNLPLAEAALFRLPGAHGVAAAGLLGPACLAALLLLFYAGLTRLHGAATAALATGALALVPALTPRAGGGDADVPLALYAGGAALYLALWWRLRRPADAVLMGLLAGGAVWTKKEGLTVAALVVLAFAAGEVVRRDRPPRRRVAATLGVTLAALVLPLPWLLFTRLTHPLGRDFFPLTPAVFAAHAGRLPHIVTMFGLQMLALGNWSLLWVTLAALALLAARRLTPTGGGLLLLLAAQVGVYMLGFVFSDWQPYTAHLQTSLDRLLTQVVPLALLALVEVVRALGPAALTPARGARAREGRPTGTAREPAA